MTASLLAGSILLADSDPLLDAVLSKEAPGKPARAALSATERPPAGKTPAKKTAAKEAPATKGKDIQPDTIATPAPRTAPKAEAKTGPAVDRDRPAPDAGPSPVAGMESATTAADLEEKAAPREALASRSAQGASFSFERSTLWIGAGLAESEYDNDGFEHDSGLSATLGYSFGIGSRWNVDLLGNYRMNKVNYYGDDEEDLNHYDVRGLLRFSLVSTPNFRLYLAGGAMYGQSDIPYRDYYTTRYRRWWRWRTKRHWYSETATGSILSGLAGGGAELSLGRLVVHGSVLTLVGGGSSDEYVYEDCDIGDGTMISVDAQYALTDSLRIGLYYQNESFGDGESSIDMTTYGAMLGLAF